MNLNNKELFFRIKKFISQEVIFSALGLFSIILLGASYFRIADNDLFARLATGRLIFESGIIPLKDPFAYSPTKDIWIDHEWLSGLLFFVIYNEFGDTGLFLFNLLIGLTTLIFLRAAQRELSDTKSVQTVLLFLTLWPSTFIWNSTIRSQVFTFLFFAIELFILARIKVTGRSLMGLWIVPLMILWANFHGGFVVGLGFLFLAGLGIGVSNRRLGICLFLITGLSCAGAIINPYGWAYLEFILEAVTKPRPEITEWGMAQLTPINGIFYAICLLSISLIFSRYRAALGLEGILFLVVSMIFGIKHQRHIPFFLFVAAIYLPEALQRFFDKQTGSISDWICRRFVALTEVVLGILSVGLIMQFVFWGYLIIKRESFSLNYSQYPVEAMSWLKANALRGNILVNFNEGSYVLWQGYPNFKVSIDGRYEEVYPDSTFDKSLAALNPAASNFKESFLAIKPDFVILCRTSTPFSVTESFPGSWRVVFEEKAGNCAVFQES